MGVDIVTTSLWLLKDLFWVVRFTWVAWAFGALAVLSQLKNFVAVFHEEFAKPTPYKLLRAFVVSWIELGLLLWLASNFVWCISELGFDQPSDLSWYQPHTRGSQSDVLVEGTGEGNDPDTGEPVPAEYEKLWPNLISEHVYDEMIKWIQISFYVAAGLVVADALIPLVWKAHPKNDVTKPAAPTAPLATGGSQNELLADPNAPRPKAPRASALFGYGGRGSIVLGASEGGQSYWSVLLEDFFMLTWVLKDMWWSIQEFGPEYPYLAQAFGCTAVALAVLVTIVRIRKVPLDENLSNFAHVTWIFGNLWWVTGELWVEKEATEDSAAQVDNWTRTLAVIFQSVGILTCFFAFYRFFATRSSTPPAAEEQPSKDTAGATGVQLAAV